MLMMESNRRPQPDAEDLLARFLEGREGAVGVDYSKSTDGLLSGGKQAIGYPGFVAEKPKDLKFRSSVRRIVRAFSHEEYFLGERDIERMQRAGFEPADAWTTISVCNAFPALQLLHPVLALGSIARWQGGSVVLCCRGSDFLAKPSPLSKPAEPPKRIAVTVSFKGGFEKRYLTLGMQ